MVENTQGDIFDPDFLDTLKKVNDEAYLTPGVDRAWVKSIWMPVVRYNEVTEEGFAGGPVMPSTYDGSPEGVETLKQNIAKAGWSAAWSPMTTSRRWSSCRCWTAIRLPANRSTTGNCHGRSKRTFATSTKRLTASTRCDVIGFAKLIGSLLDGILQVMMYFGVADPDRGVNPVLVHALHAQHGVVLLCSMIAVIWQIGILHMLGLGLTPFSVLVPFLIFAIGVSHGAQKMNGIQQDVGRGHGDAGCGPVYVPPTLCRRRDGAAERRGGFRRAAADPDSRRSRNSRSPPRSASASCCSPISSCCR